MINSGDPTQPTDGINKLFVDEEIRGNKIQKYNMEGHALTNFGYPVNLNDAITKDYVDTEPLFFDGFSGIPGRLKKIENIAPLTEAEDPTTKEYADEIPTSILNEIMENKNDMGGVRIINVGNPIEGTDDANKLFVIKTRRKMKNSRLVNLAEPRDSSDATSKNYVDNKFAMQDGISDLKIYKAKTETLNKIKSAIAYARSIHGKLVVKQLVLNKVFTLSSETEGNLNMKITIQKGNVLSRPAQAPKYIRN